MCICKKTNNKENMSPSFTFVDSLCINHAGKRVSVELHFDMFSNVLLDVFHDVFLGV